VVLPYWRRDVESLLVVGHCQLTSEAQNHQTVADYSCTFLTLVLGHPNDLELNTFARAGPKEFLQLRWSTPRGVELRRPLIRITQLQ
jgi:hypothetical protein